MYDNSKGAPARPSRAALVQAIARWAQARDAHTLSRMEDRLRPSEQSSERTAKAAEAVTREHAAWLLELDAFEAAAAAPAAPALELEPGELEPELEPQLATTVRP